MRVIRFRADLRKVARIRLREAKRLLAAKEFSGAYHLTGIAIECAIKACIAKQTRRFEFPDKAFAGECYTHDLTMLLKLASLLQQLQIVCKTDPGLTASWNVVKGWKVDSRYEHTISEQLAREMYSATASRKHGVFRWLQLHW